MSCTNCMSKYTRFNKEQGCSKCGFGFCSKCVSKKAMVPGLSPNKPVSVCDGCYNFLLNNEKKTFEEKNRCSVSSANWWGDEVLPPPSMRNISTNVAGRKQDQERYKEKQWTDLENRLARLVEHIDVSKIPSASSHKNGADKPDVTDAAGNQENQPKNNGSTSTRDDLKQTKKNKAKTIPNIEQLEERLAALKGVSIEIIRNPGIIMTPDINHDQSSEDEAERLIKTIEASPDVASVKPDHDVSQKLSVPRKIMESDDESLNSENFFCPNFKEIVQKTTNDAKSMEEEALKLLRQMEQEKTHVIQKDGTFASNEDPNIPSTSNTPIAPSSNKQFFKRLFR